MDDATSPRLFVFLCYRDPRAAIQQLIDGLGFEPVVAYPDDSGGIRHAELKLGEAVVLIQTDRDGYDKPVVKGTSTGFGPMITMPSNAAVDALHARAVAVGMTSLIAPETTAWGNHRCELLDREGFQWSFGTYVPGRPPSGNG